jgi:GT2 family glycosyltransferase
VINVSIVSHGHGSMVKSLIEKLLSFAEIKKVIVTLNTPEDINFPSNDRLFLIKNFSPKGFSANHNHAFSYCDSEFFCVINPDIFLAKIPSRS